MQSAGDISMESTDVRVARLEERFTAVQADVSEIKAAVTTQTGMLRTLTAAEERRKGAMAALARVGALIGSGGGLTALVTYFTGHWK